MTKYQVVVNTGYGWDLVSWAPTFDTEDEAWEWALDDHDWDGQVDIREITEEE